MTKPRLRVKPSRGRPPREEASRPKLKNLKPEEDGSLSSSKVYKVPPAEILSLSDVETANGEARQKRLILASLR
jgi:hypothetical protein